MEVKVIGKVIEDLKEYGILYHKPISVKIPDAKRHFTDAFNYLVKGFRWLSKYDEIIDWLSDNKERGLILAGNNGLGKTIITTRVFPILFYGYYGRIMHHVPAYELNNVFEKLLKNRFVIIDDVGQEEQSVNFGERRWAFPEIVDSIEKKRGLLIMTTNLSSEAIEEKYGYRVRDRLRAITTRIVLKGKSLRK